MPTLILAREGLSLVVDVEGPEYGPTLLMLHAGGENRGVWRPISAALQGSGWRTVALDLRAHGDSGRSGTYTLDAFIDDVLHVLREIGGGPVVIAGGSIGGVLGLIITGEALAPVDGLVLLDVPTRPRAETAANEQRKIAVAKARGMAAVAALDDQFIHSGFVADVMRNAPRWTAGARSVRVPVLLIRGEKSTAVTEADLAGIREDIPQAQFAAVDAGHLVARDRPQEVAALLADFLKSIPQKNP